MYEIIETFFVKYKIFISLANNSQSQIHFTNNQNSPNRTQDTKSPSILTSPIQKQQGIFTLQDNSQVNFLSYENLIHFEKFYRSSFDRLQINLQVL